MIGFKTKIKIYVKIKLKYQFQFIDIWNFGIFLAVSDVDAFINQLCDEILPRSLGDREYLNIARLMFRDSE